jgi:hypothetical protein
MLDWDYQKIRQRLLVQAAQEEQVDEKTDTVDDGFPIERVRFLLPTLNANSIRVQGSFASHTGLPCAVRRVVHRVRLVHRQEDEYLWSPNLAHWRYVCLSRPSLIPTRSFLFSRPRRDHRHELRPDAHARPYADARLRHHRLCASSPLIRAGPDSH